MRRIAVAPATRRLPQVRRCADEAAEAAPERYSAATRVLHAVSGGGMLGCVGLVLWAQSLPAWKDCTPEESKKKGDIMFYHKSLGLTMLGVMIPRVAMRLVTRAPAHLPGPAAMQLAGQASHLALYGLVIVMPVSGFVMGYMGGNGLPFFVTTLKPASGEIGKATNGKMAGNAYWLHCKAGQALEYMIPLHVAGAAAHMGMGHKILGRINPLA